MRKFFTYSILSLMLAGGLFYSCQKDSALDEIQDTTELKSFDSKAAKASAAAIAESFIFDINACVGVPHEFTISAAPNQNMQIQAELTPGIWTQIGQIAKSTTSSATWEYTFAVPGTYNLRFKAGSGGFTAGFSITVSECGCEESFSYETSDNLNVVFTYTSEENLEDAIVKFTCPHVLPEYGFFVNDGKFYTVNNNGNITVLTWTGDIAACQTISFDLTFNPDCTKQNKGNGGINIWTDFTVNGESKKTVTPPAEADCKTELIDAVETAVCSWPIIKYDGCN